MQRPCKIHTHNPHLFQHTPYRVHHKACILHQNPMQHLYTIHATQIQNACIMHSEPNQNPCKIYAESKHNLFEINANSVQNSCTIYAKPCITIQNPCWMHAESKHKSWEPIQTHTKSMHNPCIIHTEI